MINPSSASYITLNIFFYPILSISVLHTNIYLILKKNGIYFTSLLSEMKMMFWKHVVQWLVPVLIKRQSCFFWVMSTWQFIILFLNFSVSCSKKNFSSSFSLFWSLLLSDWTYNLSLEKENINTKWLNCLHKDFLKGCKQMKHELGSSQLHFALRCLT